MRKFFIGALSLSLALFVCQNRANAQIAKYTSGNNSWNADSLGNHRAVVHVSGAANAVKVDIPWRRRDLQPEAKNIIIVDARTRKRVNNIIRKQIDRVKGIIYFEPISGAGDYYIYYMPYTGGEGRSNYPQMKYPKPADKADPQWVKQTEATGTLASAKVSSIESIDEFNSFYPMEVIASDTETQGIISKNKGNAYLVFPEDRLHPIKMKSDLPYRWIEKGLSAQFNGEAAKGENFAFQLGIYPVKSNLENVKVSFSDLKSKNGKTIPSKLLSCLNTDGTNYEGSALKKTVAVEKGKIQAMWCLVDVPKNIAAGVYSGTATVTAANASPTKIAVHITVNNQTAVNGGVNEPQKQTRLKWLNSTLAQQNDVIAPYTPLEVKDKTISLLGRKVILNNDGFPAQIETYFTPEMTALSTKAKQLLTEPMHFHVTDKADKDIKLSSAGVQFTQTSAGTVKWQSNSTATSLTMAVNGTIEFDGAMAYSVKITALTDIELNDINMHIPLQKEVAKYLMGLNQKGGYRPEKYDWKWDVAHKNQDGAWLGDVNGGLQFSLRDEHYVRPLNTNFYLQKPLLLPTSWGNGDKGGISIGEKGKAILVNNYSGARTLHKGDVLYYNFTLLITPFHPINTEFQWNNRFYHKYDNLDTIKATGATIVNIHHATPINPWINYPFIEHVKMKGYIDEAHQKGLKVKIYNTVRELSNHAYETFALRSLGHEIYSPGKGGGFAWLQEHIGDDYLGAWFVPQIKDAAIINSGMSRWHNYYVEGMNWLTQNVGIDGIYLDDVAFDRITMKRIKRVLTRDGHPGIIDLHSANQYNKSDGFNNSAILYMEHFPYLNRLWFGEYFDYNKNEPDFFLTEVSGIPFGLMGEMLQDGGNPYRGMIYGMTNRMPWSDNADPRPLWKTWDTFGIKGSTMLGYWAESCPVKTDNKAVLATVYKKGNTAMVSIASWATSNVSVKLSIDWKALGIDPTKASISAPAIKGFQEAQTFQPGSDIPVEKGKGWIFIIKEK